MRCLFFLIILTFNAEALRPGKKWVALYQVYTGAIRLHQKKKEELGETGYSNWMSEIGRKGGALPYHTDL